ncbi:calcium/sodium antiporter [Alkaliphilus serpentinus]|uniref:Calcium/sodium antiporter n=1 Tax=Alkaliphilus serpentinus TaxID=1482731 RepID=A0A833HS56_9FIRM|nr:calcium/sodium antiporter [Alkaliphilus serpentinus]KAB3533115.1 calcium/sodium antiporter [Alkaliphilus serpentinus]
MDIIITVLLFILGLIIIIKGGDWFVESAVWLAKVTGIPSVLIGATIVSVATTLPELLVSTIATYQKFYDVAIGNVVGSLVCNIGLILGATALLSPIKISRKSFALKSGFMLSICIIVFMMSWDKMITGFEGSILLILFGIYIAMNILEFKGKNKGAGDGMERIQYDKTHATKNIFMFVLGAVFITVGARLLVTNGVAIAKLIGIPEQVVSLTLIALGTSLPELITAITSVVKGHHGISVGNIIGANILNMVMVIGLSSKIAEEGLVISYQNVMVGATIYNIPQTLYLDLPVALGLMAILFIGGGLLGKINRWIGAILLSVYSIYIFTLARLFL